MSRKLTGAIGLLITAVLLFGINIIAQNALRGARIDLTQNRIYTLTQGSKNIAASLDEPIRLRFFFSEKQTNNIPFLRAYATRVREFLEEYVAASNGMITLEIIDPEPFSEAEERAVAAGLQGVPISAGERIYFGLQGVNSTDLEETIPFFNQEREDHLEYEISALIHKLANPDRRKLAVITSVPFAGADADPMAAMMGRQPDQQPWILHNVLTQMFDVEVLDNTVSEIPTGTDVLVLIHPRGLSRETEYAIDQFVLAGGRALVFVDPHAEVYEPPANPGNPMMSMTAERGSNLPGLMDAWGVSMPSDQVVADRRLAIQVNVGNQMRPEIAQYVVWLQVNNERVNKDEFTVSQLQTINIGTAGHLIHADDADTEFIPLIRTTEDSMLLPADRIRFFPQPKELLAQFAPTSEEYVLAARVTGRARTAFPGGLDGSSEGHLEQSQGNINVIIVADVDMLEDQRWVERQNFLGRQILRPYANNGDMFVNFVDQLSGSQDLISIRGRAGFSRPFLVVRELEQQASERFAAKVRELEQKLEETQRRINDLQRGRGDAATSFILTPEQQAEIERAREEQVNTQRELRRVNLALRQDIERLGTRLKFYNIALVPLIVGFVSIGLGIFRAQRRRMLRR